MENEKEEKCRIVIIISKEEKILLRELARSDRRSMSSYLRCLLNQAIDNDFTE